MLQPARRRAKTKLSVLGDEFIRPEYSDMSPPFNVTADDVNMEIDFHRTTPGSIVSHRTLRGFSGTVNVQYITCWDDLENTSWETEQDLEHYGNGVERYWAGEPKQVDGEKAKYRAYRVQMAKRSQAWSAGEVYVPPRHKHSCDSSSGPEMHSTGIVGWYNLFKTTSDGWQFAKVIRLAEDAESVKFPHTH